MGKHRGGDSDDSGSSGGGRHRQPQTCTRCNGRGTVTVGGDGRDGNSAGETKTCGVCRGSGTV